MKFLIINDNKYTNLKYSLFLVLTNHFFMWLSYFFNSINNSSSSLSFSFILFNSLIYFSKAITNKFFSSYSLFLDIFSIEGQISRGLKS